MIPRRFFWLFDLTVVCLAFVVAYVLFPFIYTWLLGGEGLLRSPWFYSLFSPTISNGILPPAKILVWILLVVAPTVLVVLTAFGNYEPLIDQSRTRVVASSFVAILVGVSLAALILVTLNSTDWSRLFAFIFASFSAIGLAVYRLALRWYFRHRRAVGYYAKNLLLIGPTSAIDWMADYFGQHISPTYYRVIGYLRVHPDQVPSANRISTKHGENLDVYPYPPLGDVSELGDLLVHRPVHEVIVAQPASGGDWLTQVIRDCEYFRVTLRIVPEALLLIELGDFQNAFHTGPLGLPAITLTPPHWDSEALFLKRLFDIVVSAILMILAAPLFLVIALAIKITTPGLPVFYPWRVVGRNGVEFTGFKFTTMAADADERRQELLDQNEMTGPVFKISSDPRVTPLGRFLRKYSLNELPQLWSVFKGDMSLVGPRPAFRHELERYELWHKRKLSIRPGITCLWQIRGRNKIRDFDDWVNMDLEYIEKWSLWLDFKILVRTAFVVFAPAEG